VIWKRVAGRTLTPEVARQLLEEGKTREVLSGFRSRAGKPFRARLVMDQDGKVEFEFPVSRKRQAEQGEEEETAPAPAAAE
jgi:DNA topoisomerase-3